MARKQIFVPNSNLNFCVWYSSYQWVYLHAILRKFSRASETVQGFDSSILISGDKWRPKLIWSIWWIASRLAPGLTTWSWLQGKWPRAFSPAAPCRILTRKSQWREFYGFKIWNFLEICLIFLAIEQIPNKCFIFRPESRATMIATASTFNQRDATSATSSAM